jgi:hypothetical protein
MTNNVQNCDVISQSLPCGGGIKCLHRGAASRKRRQKGNPDANETVRYCHRVLRDLDLRVTALARSCNSSTSKLQSRPLVREGAPQEENRECLIIFSMEVKETFFAFSGWWPVRMKEGTCSYVGSVGKSGHRKFKIPLVRFEVLTAATMKNAVLWDIKTQFVPHRGRITSPLQGSVG